MKDAALRRRAGRCLDRLESAFGRPRLRRRLPPLDELILTILSQNTSDTNRDRAYASLRRRFPDWGSALRAKRGDLEKAIRVGGLARTKSRVIRDLLRRVRDDQGDLTLEVLERMPAAEARRYLRSFKGVGEKTACCVLLFACGHPAFPVDTHIHRVTRRLGWVPEKADAERAHAILAALIPPRRYLTAHVNLITLGRRLCRPRAPSCPACPLRSSCPDAARRGHASARGARRGMVISPSPTIFKDVAMRGDRPRRMAAPPRGGDLSEGWPDRGSASCSRGSRSASPWEGGPPGVCPTSGSSRSSRPARSRST